MQNEQTFNINDGKLNKPLIHEWKEPSEKKYMNKTIIITVFIILAGIISGFSLSRFNMPGSSTDIKIGTAGESADKKIVVGSTDAKTFKDSAEGKIEKDGINGEGTHKLIRPGGESQTVALTSSVLDLSQFEEKNVKVWGETFAAKKAGWLMDVGKVEVSSQ